MCSPFHHINLANVHRTALAVDSNDHCQGYRCLCGSDSNDEDGKNLTSQVGGVGLDLVKEREANHIDIDGIEHYLNTHQYSDGIALGQCAVEPDAEKNCTKHQEVVQRESHIVSPLCRSQLRPQLLRAARGTQFRRVA